MERENDIIRRKECLHKRFATVCTCRRNPHAGYILPAAQCATREPPCLWYTPSPSSALRNRYHTGTNPRTSAKKRDKQSQCRSERARRADARAAYSPPPKRSPRGASATNGRKRGETLDCRDNPAAPSKKSTAAPDSAPCVPALSSSLRKAHILSQRPCAMLPAAPAAPFRFALKVSTPSAAARKRNPTIQQTHSRPARIQMGDAVWKLWVFSVQRGQKARCTCASATIRASGPWCSLPRPLQKFAAMCHRPRTTKLHSKHTRRST